mmetsp:Transcript_44701/g.148198  ORF Transcript_44701/g.148198 Transcript_44701/m.148198 type:complete len:243 (+) Transcript_44701:236-964(+)
MQRLWFRTAATPAFGATGAWAAAAARRSLHERVQQHAANADPAAEHLDRLERLAKCKRDADNDDDALGRVCDGLGGGRGLLDGEGGELVVEVEVEPRGDEVARERLARLEQLDERAEALRLEEEPKGEDRECAEDCRERKLVASRSDPVRQAGGVHQLLVLVGAESGKEVGDARGQQGPDREIKLLERGEADAPDDRDEAKPLGLGDGLAVQSDAQECGKGGLSGLDDLGKGDGAEVHREDG